jgi:hypothetical protein
MRYYRLTDNVYIEKRWHLGEVMHGDIEPLFKSGMPFRGTLSTCIHHGNKPLQFCLTSFAVPIAHEGLAQAMALVAPHDLQRLPVDIPGHPGYEVINVIRVLDCLDEPRSKVELYPPGYHRASLVGNYMTVEEPHMDASRIPPGVHAFRVARWHASFIVSEVMKDAMERAGCEGATFTDVT